MGLPLHNLKNRWDDEKKYENINDYKDVIQSKIKYYPIIKMTKAPFGFVIPVQDKKLHFFIKRAGGKQWVRVKSI